MSSNYRHNGVSTSDTDLIHKLSTCKLMKETPNNPKNKGAVGFMRLYLMIQPWLCAGRMRLLLPWFQVWQHVDLEVVGVKKALAWVLHQGKMLGIWRAGIIQATWVQICNLRHFGTKLSIMMSKGPTNYWQGFCDSAFITLGISKVETTLTYI